jgi:hypothetical protein
LLFKNDSVCHFGLLIERGADGRSLVSPLSARGR